MENTSLPVEDKISKNEEEIRKIEEEITQLKLWVIALIVLAAIAILLGIFWVRGDQINWSEKLDRLGSYAGGFSGSLLALASMVFIYQGLLKQQQQLLRQRSDIDLTLEEIKKQNDQWEFQRTEDTYFVLLANFQSIGVPSGNGNNKNHQVDYLGNTILKLAVGVPSSDDFETYRKNVSSRIEDWFLKPDYPGCLKIAKELVFIIKFLLKKKNAEHLLEHICTTTTKGEKLLLFCYLFLDAEGIREIEDWYFDSEMLDRDINLNLRRLLSPTKVPPFSQEDIKNFEVF